VKLSIVISLDSGGTVRMTGADLTYESLAEILAMLARAADPESLRREAAAAMARAAGVGS
jgi:hypothetical protein